MNSNILNGVLFTPNGVANLIAYLYEALRGTKTEIVYEEYFSSPNFSFPEKRKQIFFFAGDLDSELICDILETTSFDERILTFDFICERHQIGDQEEKELKKVTNNKLFLSCLDFDYFKEIAECLKYLAEIQIKNDGKLLSNKEMIEKIDEIINQKEYKRTLNKN